jgi:hypothetical protein
VSIDIVMSVDIVADGHCLMLVRSWRRRLRAESQQWVQRPSVDPVQHPQSHEASPGRAARRQDRSQCGGQTVYFREPLSAVSRPL